MRGWLAEQEAAPSAGRGENAAGAFICFPVCPEEQGRWAESCLTEVLRATQRGDSPSWDLTALTCPSVVPVPEVLRVHSASLPFEGLASYDLEFLIPWLCHVFRGRCFPDVYAAAGQ